MHLSSPNLLHLIDSKGCDCLRCSSAAADAISGHKAGKGGNVIGFNSECQTTSLLCIKYNELLLKLLNLLSFPVLWLDKVLQQ